jgi:hypothetical protein
MSYTITIDGYSWDHGLTKFFAIAAKELLLSQFPEANIVVIQER